MWLTRQAKFVIKRNNYNKNKSCKHNTNMFDIKLKASFYCCFLLFFPCFMEGCAHNFFERK